MDGVIDKSGLAVSFIQSLYHEFGSGVVLPESGIVWQNRGASFSLDPSHLLALARQTAVSHPQPRRRKAERWPGDGVRLHGRRRPTANPGRYFHPLRAAKRAAAGEHHPTALAAGTYLGQTSDSLKLEGRFSAECVARLRQLGHDVEVLADFSEAMGHAGAIVRHPNGLFEGPAIRVATAPPPDIRS